MFIDVVGFTQLSQRNEEKALALLDEYREVLRPLFSTNGGKEVKTIGDGFLVEFGSALQAVRCAFGIQQALHDRNSSRSGDAVKARIGVHVGDVVHSQNDIYGDAVNIASRIEPLADAGGICISQPVQVQVFNKFEFPIVSLGAKILKNVYEPMEVFKIVLPWERSSVEAQGQSQPRTRIAVLPFSNISQDRSDEYFADGMTEELTNVISHNRQLKVIARTTAGRFKGTPKSIQEIGKEIGAGTILEGSVRKSGNKVRVTAQLIDAITEDHLWSDNYDRQLDDVFTIQSEIANSVSKALTSTLLSVDQPELDRKATKSPTAHIKYLRGRAILRDRSEANLKEAKRLFEEAIAEDDQYADAYVGLADAYHLLSNYGHMSGVEAMKKGKDALQQALKLDDKLAEAHNTLAEYLTTDYRYEEAVQEFETAISINPNYSLAHHWFAICLIEMGDLSRSNEETMLALELDPLSAPLVGNLAYGYANAGDFAHADEQLKKLDELDPSAMFTDPFRGLVADAKGDFRSAAAYMEEAVKHNPERLWYSSMLAYCLAKIGEKEKALKMLERLTSLPDDSEEKASCLAVIYAGLQMHDEMFRQFNLAFENHTLLFRVLRYASFRKDIAADPRYRALFQRANLSP